MDANEEREQRLHDRKMERLGQAEAKRVTLEDELDESRKEVTRLNLQIEELKKENQKLFEKKVGIPRLIEAMASAPGGEERKALVDEIDRLNRLNDEIKRRLKSTIEMPIEPCCKRLLQATLTGIDNVTADLKQNCEHCGKPKDSQNHAYVCNGAGGASGEAVRT